MRRVFHPVGQGAFYSEQSFDFIMVYDCGSDNNIPLIVAQIKDTFNYKQKIDKLFISHFDSDHVNGLEFMLKHCDVKEIYIPFMFNLEKAQLFAHISVKGEKDPFVERLINDPVETIHNVSKGTNVIFVLPIDSEGKSLEDRLSRDDLKDAQVIISGYNITSDKIDNWVFVPFNFQSSTRSELFSIELKKGGIEFTDVNSFKMYWDDPGNRDSILTAYKAIPGGFNTNSMTLYSGPSNNENYYRMCALSSYHAVLICRHCSAVIDVGCLYLGDYEAKGKAKWKELYSNYGPYWDNIHTIQIPHHGSKYNYNPKLNSDKPMISVISCGKINRHRHPHSHTLRSIIMDGGRPIVVTEVASTKAEFHIFP